MIFFVSISRKNPMSPFWFTKKEFVDEKESHGLAKILFINFVCTVLIKEVIFFFQTKNGSNLYRK